MSSDDNYRKMKQKYLREQILLEEFDQQEFAKFLEEGKADGTNIDNWEFDELINKVEDFKALQRRTTTKIPPVEQLELSEDNHENQFKNANIDRQEFNTLTKGEENKEFQEDYEVNYSEQINANIQNNPDKKDIVIIKRDQKKSDTFVMKLIPDDIIFTRKLKDFYWMQTSLQVEFPFYYIPPIKAVDNKENFLQNFLNRIMDMKMIQDSEVVKTFVNDSKFMNIKPKPISNVPHTIEKKIKNSFNEPKKQQFFQQNEKVYDNLLSKILDKYNDRKNSNKYFEAIFTNLNLFCTKNSTIFSQLKHHSYDLVNILGQTGQLIHKIANLYNQFLSEQNSVFSKMGFKPDQRVEKTQKMLKTGLYEWGAQLLSQKKFVNDYMASFYHYNKHEFLSMADLLQTKLKLSNAFNAKTEELNKKKYKLFQTRDVQKWKVPQEIFKKFDIKTVFDDFERVKDHMLPEESKPFLKDKKISQFLDKHVLFEYLNFYTTSQFYIRENFIDFTNKMMQTFQKRDNLWNIFFQEEELDLDYYDRESSVNINKQFVLIIIMSDELCVNIFDEINQTTSQLTGGVFQGMQQISSNPMGNLFLFLLMIIFVSMTYYQMRERSKLGQSEKSTNLEPDNRRNIQQIINQQMQTEIKDQISKMDEIFKNFFISNQKGQKNNSINKNSTHHNQQKRKK